MHQRQRKLDIVVGLPRRIDIPATTVVCLLVRLCLFYMLNLQLRLFHLEQRAKNDNRLSASDTDGTLARATEIGNSALWLAIPPLVAFLLNDSFLSR